MPEDNVWLLQRRAEHAALTKLLTVIGDNPARAVQGADRPTTPTGTIPLNLDMNRHRRAQT
jgi:hypothetical protein